MFVLRCVLRFVTMVRIFSTVVLRCEYATVSTVLHTYDYNMGTFYWRLLCMYIEDCEGWWLSGCRGSVAEHWRLKPEVSWPGSTPGDCRPLSSIFTHNISWQPTCTCIEHNEVEKSKRNNFSFSFMTTLQRKGSRLHKMSVQWWNICNQDQNYIKRSRAPFQNWLRDQGDLRPVKPADQECLAPVWHHAIEK